MTMPGPRAYRRLAALLRDQITSGILAPGAQLPPIGNCAISMSIPGRQSPRRWASCRMRGSSAGGRDWATSWRTRMSNGTHLASRKAGPLRPDD
jgi:DNA-binding transcriptional MocR family regulator